MKLPIKTLLSALFALGFLAILQPTSAGAQVLFVSSSGDNTKDCLSPANACKTFGGALSKVSDGGTIQCASTGFFGDLNITKSVTIDCAEGGGGSNVTYISIATAGSVRVKNIAVNTAGALDVISNPLNGISIDSASAVYLENVYVTGSEAIGVYDRRSNGTLLMTNSAVVTNRGPGIVIAPFNNGRITAFLDGVKAHANSYGIAIGSRGRVMANRSTFVGNATTGVHADSGATIEIEGSLMAGNPTGVLANSGSFVSISNSRINSNNTGISGSTTSYGNNKFFANAASDGTTPTPASLR